MFDQDLITLRITAALSIFVFFTFFSGCNFFEDAFPPPPDEPPPQTSILRIDIIPDDTVAVKDTALIHCVIEDSLDESFKFRWLLDDTLAVNGTTNGPKIRYVAPDWDITEGYVGIVSGRVEN